MAGTYGASTERIIAGWMDVSSKHYSGNQVAADASYSASSKLGAEQELRPLHYFEMKERIIASIGIARAKWAMGMPKQALCLAIKAIDDGRIHPDDLARKQCALGWELRLTLTAARACTSRGEKNRAREMLKYVYSRFTEGFESNDLRAAAQAHQAL